MVPVTQQQQQAGMSGEMHMTMQQQHAASQQMRQMPMQQAGYTQAMYSQPGMMRQQPGGYPNVPQAALHSAAEQSTRPMSPPGLPRGPSHPMAQSQRAQVKSPASGYVGPQMIRPSMAGGQMVGSHMAGSQMVGNQMAASLATSPNSPSALHPSSPGLAPGGSSNGTHVAVAQPQLGPQPSNSGSSRPNSASSQEGSGSAGQGHRAFVPTARTASGPSEQAQQAALRYQSGSGALQMPPGYATSAHGTAWAGGMPPGMAAYTSSGQSNMMHGEPSLAACT